MTVSVVTLSVVQCGMELQRCSTFVMDKPSGVSSQFWVAEPSEVWRVETMTVGVLYCLVVVDWHVIFVECVTRIESTSELQGPTVCLSKGTHTYRGSGLKSISTPRTMESLSVRIPRN